MFPVESEYGTREGFGLLTRLHGDEGAPDGDGGTVEQAGYDVAGEEDEVGPFALDVDGEPLPQGSRGRLSGAEAEEGLLLVGAAGRVAVDGRDRVGDGAVGASGRAHDGPILLRRELGCRAKMQMEWMRGRQREKVCVQRQTNHAIGRRKWPEM